MQNRPRFTGTLIISTIIHFGMPGLTAMLLALTQMKVQHEGLQLACYVYLPFLLSGCVIGLHPYLIRPVLAALISSSLIFLLFYLSQSIYAAPAILISTLAAFFTQNYKIRPSGNIPLEQDVDKRSDSTAGQGDEHAEHEQD